MATNIIHTTADIFSLPAQALVNPVNLVGVMGKGLALQFKQRYPEVFTDYRRAIEEGELVEGLVQAVSISNESFYDTNKPEIVVNFPTKYHWREASPIELVERGLRALAQFVVQTKIYSIAIPPLGCGCGGLDHEQVLYCVEDQFLPQVEKYLKICYLVRF